MPIRFACMHCGRRLNAEKRKSGAQVKCPQCKRKIRVPLESDRHKSVEVEWVYEEDASEKREVRIDQVIVSRRVLFAQGILLGTISLVSFLLGILLNYRSGPSHAGAAGPVPASISGMVSFRSTLGRLLPDSGAVVIAVPRDRQPGRNERPPIDGLRPGDPLPNHSNLAVTTIRLLGGGFTRADLDGSYTINVPDGGKFYLLVLSNHLDRRPDDELDKRDLAQIGRYFLPAMELLGSRKYTWKPVVIAGQTQIDVPLNSAAQE